MLEKVNDFAQWYLSLEKTDQEQGRQKIEELLKDWAVAEEKFDKHVAYMKEEEATREWGASDEGMMEFAGAFGEISYVAEKWSRFFGDQFG